MEMYSKWFVLQVKTGKEYFIKGLLDKCSIVPLDMKIFSKEVIHINHNVKRKLLKPLFPGYIFIHSNVMKILDICKSNIVSEIIQPVCFRKEARCPTCFTERSPCMVNANEMKLLLSVTDFSGKFKISHVYKIGDDIFIKEGPLKNLKGKIIFYNVSKQRVGVEINLFGRKIKTTLGIEFVN